MYIMKYEPSQVRIFIIHGLQNTKYIKKYVSKVESSVSKIRALSTYPNWETSFICDNRVKKIKKKMLSFVRKLTCNQIFQLIFRVFGLQRLESKYYTWWYGQVDYSVKMFAPIWVSQRGQNGFPMGNKGTSSQILEIIEIGI